MYDGRRIYKVLVNISVMISYRFTRYFQRPRIVPFCKVDSKERVEP